MTIAAASRLDWRAIWRQHRDGLIAYALALTGNSHDAEDILQAVFVRLIERAVVSDQPVAYAFRAVRNAAADIHRASERDRRLLDARATLDTDALNAASPSDSDRTNRIFELLDHLPDAQREVILLRTRSGLTLAQIGTALDRPEGTVTAQYSRGLSRLRELAAETRVTT